MAAGAGRDGDQPVGALLDGLVREAVVDDVMQDDAAIGMRGWLTSSRAPREVMTIGALYFVAISTSCSRRFVGPVHDLVDGKRRRGRVRMGAVPGGELLGDLRQPFVEQGGGPRVERGKRSHHARLALGDDELRTGNDEQGRGDDRKAQTIAQDGRQGTRNSPVRMAWRA